MNFADRITRSPVPHDPERGAEVAALFTGVPDSLRGVVAGTAGCSPYLSDLLRRETDWITSAFDDPEQAFEALMADVAEVAADRLTAELRQAKRRVALLTALADLAGVWSLEEVTARLTRFADAAVQIALVRLVAAEVARGRLPATENPDHACGMFVLAMGKMGAGELNYSSDIDLICLFDESLFSPEDYHEVRAAFIRVTRKMTAILSDVREGGYVFRTDLRLRPDAAVTPVCMSMEAAERYYESVGRTWERAAYIKARVCAGDKDAGARFLKALSPFVWRKHLDFAAIQDAHDMRLKIRDHKGLHGPLVLEGHNMKLGRGGIREIEFFTQTRQLIAGGRDATLRDSTTRGGLALLADAGWVPQDIADQLYDHYRFHREVEHRLQMINDAQTQTLPVDEEGFDRLASFMGTSGTELREELTERIEAVHNLIEGFFAPDEVAETAVPDWGSEVVSRWHSYPALRSTRATEIFKRLRPEILGRLQEAAKPDEALAQFDGFLRGLPAGVQLFALFEANPQLTQLIVDICATAPALAQYLSRNASVFDAVIGGSFFSEWPGAAALEAALVDHLQDAGDYEAQLLAARRWAKEWHFRVGVHFLRGLVTAEQGAAQYADLADAVLRALWPIIISDFARKHGPPPGRGGAIVAMGSLGVRRLHASSDLDLIMIYDPQDQDSSDGPRPLATRSYFARLTQALVTALTAPMAEGRLYEVDMRLRPSGRQGPVATSLQAFGDYQRNEAWTWEHLALTRARPVAGDASLCADIDAIRQDVISEKSRNPGIRADVAEMRRRLSEVRGDTGEGNPKSGAGRLQDIELFAQTLALMAGSPTARTDEQLAAGAAAGLITTDQADSFALAAERFWQLQMSLRLLTGGTVAFDTLGEGALRLILREIGAPDRATLERNLQDESVRAQIVITKFLEG